MTYVLLIWSLQATTGNAGVAEFLVVQLVWIPAVFATFFKLFSRVEFSILISDFLSAYGVLAICYKFRLQTLRAKLMS